MRGMITRRSVLRGLIAAPIVVAAPSLMRLPRYYPGPIVAPLNFVDRWQMTRQAITDELYGGLRHTYGDLPLQWNRVFNA